MTLEEVAKAISECAFVTSELPVVLSLEVIWGFKPGLANAEHGQIQHKFSMFRPVGCVPTPQMHCCPEQQAKFAKTLLKHAGNALLTVRRMYAFLAHHATLASRPLVSNCVGKEGIPQEANHSPIAGQSASAGVRHIFATSLPLPSVRRVDHRRTGRFARTDRLEASGIAQGKGEDAGAQNIAS